MNKLERGTRNMRKIETIAERVGHGSHRTLLGRGKVTLWNPTASDTMTVTLHNDDARLLVQMGAKYETSPEYAEKFLLALATVSGLQKVLNWAWSNATYKQVN